MFLSWLERPDDALLATLMEHPGYRAVVEHSGTWGSAITPADVVNAVAGLPSPMYGLAGARDNVEAIRGAVEYVEANRGRITDLVDASLARLFTEDVAYPLGLHCIVGYDWGIGLRGNVAINLNSRLYLDDLREIGYMLIHEATHVAYERIHGPMGLQGLEQPGGFQRLVHTLIQNEGLAVYSALQARVEGGCLGNQDYRFLFDPAVLASKTAALNDLLRDVTTGYPGYEAVGRVFDRLSGERLSYVVGCSAFVNLERKGGMALVRQAAFWTPLEFVEKALPSDLSQRQTTGPT